MLGFLGCYNPWEYNNIKRTYSPIHAHGALLSDREYIYQRLYQAAARKWKDNNITSHGIGLYSHDKAAISSFFVNGFGMHLMDAVRPMDAISVETPKGYQYYELNSDNKEQILELKNGLINHLADSPTFLYYPQTDINHLAEEFKRRNARYFVASFNDEIVAFLEITKNGENFATYYSSMLNICGAFCKEEHRGNGVYSNLLNYVITTLKEENYSILGVDFESYNPTAHGFWLKYFTSYTTSLLRVII
jgi:GNAT superfamily N-acetyltransferase